VQNNPGGVIVSAGAGVVTFYDDVTHNGTEVRTNAGSRTVFFGAQSGAGPFTGTGTVEYSGDLRPGNSPAIVTHEGSVVLNPSAKFVVEIGGPTPGTQHDQLRIAGRLQLGGILDVQFLNGYHPAPGQSFTIIDLTGAGPANGTFAGMPEGSNFVVDGVPMQVSYLGGTGNDVVLTASPVPEPAGVLAAGLVAVVALRRWVRR
jgi:hypothetical protein